MSAGANGMRVVLSRRLRANSCESAVNRSAMAFVRARRSGASDTPVSSKASTRSLRNWASIGVAGLHGADACEQGFVLEDLDLKSRQLPNRVVGGIPDGLVGMHVVQDGNRALDVFERDGDAVPFIQHRRRRHGVHRQRGEAVERLAGVGQQLTTGGLERDRIEDGERDSRHGHSRTLPRIGGLPVLWTATPAGHEVPPDAG